MKILVTAGNTQTPIDRVRCLTNIFTGRTGAQIAMAATARGHAVTLFTSHPETISDPSSVQIAAYRSFDELHTLMASAIPDGEYDAIIHAAAIGDYHLAGTYAPVAGTTFDVTHGAWSHPARLTDVSGGKIKSHHPELWLRLTPTPKLIDMIRDPWRFRGVLVKFKLEVGLSNADLLTVAEQSRRQSQADLMVANTLDGRDSEAFIGAGQYQRVTRSELPATLLERVEGLSTNRSS
jgi:phosphopantothenate-cysteine ligase/phosphopantothenoylcysteine decarboxylase/phosphopantothenate--cysteine ligase